MTAVDEPDCIIVLKCEDNELWTLGCSIAILNVFVSNELCKGSNYSVISWGEEVMSQSDDDDVSFTLDQQSYFYFYSASLLNQQFTVRDFALLGHFISIQSWCWSTSIPKFNAWLPQFLPFSFSKIKPA